MRDNVMDLWSKMLLPWMSIRLPASGDVTMNYHPWTNWGVSNPKAGDPKIENEIFANVALPGKQLGKLTKAVLALIEQADKAAAALDEKKTERPAAFQELKDLADDIAARKTELLATAKRDAATALECLKSADPQAYREIIESEYGELERRE